MYVQRGINRRAALAVLAGWPLGIAARAVAQTDTCVDAPIVVGTGPFSFDNSLAKRDGPGHKTCAEFGQDQIDGEVWYCWSSECNGEITVDTCGQTGVDTKIAIYEGCACPTGDENLLGCNDDWCGLQSSVGFTAVPSASYLIRIGSSPGASGGTGTMTISCDALDNDYCAGAEAISGVGSFAFDNTSAGRDGPSHEACLSFGQRQFDRDLWYCWTAPCTNTVFVKTCDLTSVDTKLAVYEGCTCPAAEAELLACNDDACGLQSQIGFAATAGQSYLVRVGSAPDGSGFPAEGGSGAVHFNCGAAGCEPGHGWDLAEFAQFQVCFTHEPADIPGECDGFDSEPDNDIDLVDYAVFFGLFCGP